MALAALAALVVAACGGSQGSSTNTSGPLRVMVDVPITGGAATGGIPFPYGANAAQAAAKAVNAQGGINGRQLQVDVCDNKGDPNQSATCGRQAASNGDVAVLGSWDISGANALLPILQREGIPYMGALPGLPIELQNPVSFQFDGGVAVGTYAIIGQTIAEGCKNVVTFNPTGVATNLGGQIQSAYDSHHVASHLVPFTTGTPDVTPAVSQALGYNPDCVTFAAAGQDGVKIFTNLRKAGSNARFFTAVGSLIPPLLQSLGPTANGINAINTAIVPSPATPDPKVKQFVNDLVSYYGGDVSKAAPNFNEFAQDGWSSVQLLKLASQGMGRNITPKALLGKLPTMCDVDVGNVYPHVNFCKQFRSKTYPRLFNTYVRFFTVKNGQYTETDNQWHNIAEYVPAQV